MKIITIAFLCSILWTSSALADSQNSFKNIVASLSQSEWCENHPERCEKRRILREETKERRLQREHRWCERNPKKCEALRTKNQNNE